MRRPPVGQPKLFALRKHGEPEQPPIEEAMTRAGIPRPEPEFLFTGARDWRFDYAWPAFRIALEIEGGTFGRLIVITSGHERRKGKSIPIKPGTCVRLGGRHNRGAGFDEDCVKYNHAAILGWMVIRVTTPMVKSGAAVATLRAAFSARGLE